MFHKYQHIERFGTCETEGIEFGTCYIFPKIDGTNSCVWLEDGKIKAGSRRKELDEENDNANFYKEVLKDDNIRLFLNEHPDLILYGEWLVPHSLKTYREDAWRKFYVFDVAVPLEDDELKYLPYDDYAPIMKDYNIDYIPAIRILNNGTYEQFTRILDDNNYLIKDGFGQGEGIVIKNYQYRNKFGRVTWAKIVTSEFKEKHHKEMGAPIQQGGKIVEEGIVEFCTEAMIKKVYEKIRVENDGWSSKHIPQLLGIVYHDLINEEIWTALKKLKFPTVNFKTLQFLVNNKIKQILPELF